MSKVRALNALCAALAGIVLSGTALAEPAPSCRAYCGQLPDVRYGSVEDIPDIFIHHFQRAEFLEGVISSELSIIRHASEDKRHLTREYLERVQKQEALEIRRQGLTQAIVYDLDLDGFVTAVEIEEVLRGAETGKDDKRGTRRRDELMRMDTNGDGRISMQEAAESRTQKNYSRGGTNSDRIEKMLALDMDGDGKLSDLEVTAMLYAAFAVLDKDGDGRLSLQERRPAVERAGFVQEKAQIRERMAKCRVPKPADDEDIAFLGTRTASTYSTAGISTDHQNTVLAEVSVSELDKKTYLVLASLQPMVWDITGNANHISQIVVFGPRGSSTMAQAGVRGFDKDRVTFRALEDCLPQLSHEMHMQQDGKMAMTVAALEVFLGRAPTVAQGMDMLYEASLLRGGFVVVRSVTPGKLDNPQAGFDAEIWQDLIARGQMDLRYIAAADVITPLIAVDRTTLPGAYGLAKLVHDGVLQKVPTGRFARVFDRGSGNTLTILGSNISVTEDGEKQATEMRRVQIYDYRLKRAVESFRAGDMGFSRLLVPENIKPPEDLGLRLCANKKGPVGEHVYAPHCTKE